MLTRRLSKGGASSTVFEGDAVVVSVGLRRNHGSDKKKSRGSDAIPRSLTGVTWTMQGYARRRRRFV